MFAEAAAQGAVMAAQEVLEAALASRPRQHGKISSGLFSVAAVEQLTAALVETIADWTSRNRPSGRASAHSSS